MNAEELAEKHLNTDINTELRTRCENWSRVMGYYRPTTFWNIGKRQEFKDRKFFKEPSLEALKWKQ